MLISVIILTKNRWRLLNKNLASLKKQKLAPQQIVIVDNNSTDKTPLIIKEYQKFLPIKKITTKITGYPKIYNLAVKNSNGKLLCFLDDDCIASTNWLLNLIKFHKKYPNAVIQGNTLSLPKNNLYAQIMANHYQNWLKANKINKNELQFLDNKNCLIPKKILTCYGGFCEKNLMGSEDIELAIRLRKNGIKIIFASSALAWHYERTTFKEFLKQHYRIAKSEAAVDKNLKNLKIGIFPYKKTLLNILSFFLMEKKFITQKNFYNVIRLPFIYLILFLTRTFGYLKTILIDNNE